MSQIDFTDIMRRAAGYLARQVLQDGAFVYIRSRKGEVLDKQYNMLRHCGSVWAMAGVQKIIPDAELADAIVRAAAFMRANLVVCQSPQTEGDMLQILDHKFAKLGGNALAYLAFDESGLMEPALKQGLLNGLRFFLTEDAACRFYKFNPYTGHVTDLVSEYYPGEAALAFCVAREFVLAEKLIRTLKVTRDKDKVLQDHWLMQALEHLLKHSRTLPTAQAEELQHFILQYYRDIYAQIDSDRYYWGRNTPMACRAEGLLSYIAVLHSTGDVAGYIKVRSLLDKIMVQLVSYQASGGIVDGAFIDLKKARIDYTQHSLSSFLRYYQHQQSGIL